MKSQLLRSLYTLTGVYLLTYIPIYTCTLTYTSSIINHLFVKKATYFSNFVPAARSLYRAL